MTLHYSDAAVEALAKKIAQKKSRKYVIGVGLAVLLASGTAYAAVRVFGFGSIDSEAAIAKKPDRRKFQIDQRHRPRAHRRCRSDRDEPQHV
ncbi:hypothetical protein [Winogradskya humida]|uniref:Uncharacterized protein n=1 Tax=Winogradskya humida TaxID=113566 RepID=A0ABQ4A7P1_9ACTN|nr:hypothetical protein [Actinoplanes humidus]GIE26868.1 hypothetical protein Ahu01nite_099700 [Actinoplanes humidus]